MKNKATKITSKLSSVKFINGIKAKIKKNDAPRFSSDPMLFLNQA